MRYGGVLADGNIPSGAAGSGRTSSGSNVNIRLRQTAEQQCQEKQLTDWVKRIPRRRVLCGSAAGGLLLIQLLGQVYPIDAIAENNAKPFEDRP